MLQDDISTILTPDLCPDPETYAAFKTRLAAGALTRDENSRSHFCVYFLPYDAQAKKLFIGHHKKSGLWLSPGGHIDKDETILGALNREIGEELGVFNFFKETPLPFLFFLTLIQQDVRPCKEHYDLWYLMRTDGADFNIDPREFHATQWSTLAHADTLLTDPANKKALEIIRTF